MERCNPFLMHPITREVDTYENWQNDGEYPHELIEVVMNFPGETDYDDSYPIGWKPVTQ